MTPDLVIFDCDGVLVDTEGPTSEVIAGNLAGYGLPLHPSEVEDLFIGGTMMGVEAEARQRGATPPDAWLPEIYDAIFARLAKGVAVIDGLLPLLDALDASKVPQFVASNGPTQKMRVSLGPSGLWDRFGGDAGGRILSREDHAPKPDPAMIRHAIAQTGADAGNTIMIDDSPSGCQAALNAGITCIGFDAYGRGDRLAELGIPLATSMGEVRRLILG